MRSRWVDINVDMYDYLEARVEALVNENRRLNLELEAAKKAQEEKQKDRQDDEYQMSSVLVCGMPLQAAKFS